MTRALAGVLLALALARAAAFGVAMVPASLTHDELLSITRYAARGPRYALTHYDEPNNHILFNAVSGAFPGRGSAHPPRAKAVSVVAVVLMLGALGAFFWRRGLALECAGLVALLVTHRLILGLWLSARGYGMLAMFAALASIGILAWRETGRPIFLAGLGAACVLGVWTVPTFLLFAAPLLALVFLLAPGRATAVAVLAAAAVTLLVHAPVLGAMRVALGTYGEAWGRDFASVSEAALLLKLALLPALAGRLPDALLWAALAVLVGATVWRARAGSREARASLVLFGAVAAFLAACLLLQTPVLRSTVFILVPFDVALVLAVGALVRGASRPAPRALAAGAASACVLALCVRPPLVERFEPEEHWKEVAEALERTFPDGVEILPTLGSLEKPEPRWGDFLHAHLRRPEAFPTVTSFDRAAFLAGRLVVHERPLRAAEHLERSSLPARAFAIRIPQTYIGYQALWFVPRRAR